MKLKVQAGARIQARSRHRSDRARRRLLAVVVLVAIAAAAVLSEAVRSAVSVVPGQNGKIAVASFANSRWQVVALSPDGSALTSLTPSAGLGLQPAWSPDGSRIAYECSNFQLCVMNADGSAQTPLTDTGPWSGTYVYDIHPSWSPDGSRIVFASNRGASFDIYTINADGSALKRLGGTAGFDSHPVWSPDGTRIAFSNDEAIYVMGSDGTNLIKLTRSSGPSLWPAWSPDGTRVLFTRTIDHIERLYVRSADGGAAAAVTVTKGPWDAIEPTWSPDGAMISYVGDRGGTWRVYLANSDGSGSVPLTSAPVPAFFPDWQPLQATTEPPLVPVVSPPEPTGDALLVGNFLGRLAQLTALHQAIGVTRSDASVLRLVRFCVAAQHALTAERPESVKGNTAQKLAISAFGSFAQWGRESVLLHRAREQRNTEAALRHRLKRDEALDRASSAVMLLGRLMRLG